MKRYSFKYLKISGLTLSLLFGACDLDEVHYSSVTPDTFFTSRESTYAVMARPFTHLRWFIGGDRWYLQELTTDAMACPQRGSDWYNGGEYFRLQYHTWNPDDRFVENTYNGVGGGIARTMSAKEDLEALDYSTVGMTEQDQAEQVQQLETLIAYFYMRGLDYFGGMPIYESTQDEVRPRASAQETFDHIENLLTNAIPNLDSKSELGAYEDGYIRQAAAAALLAQLYFNAEAYTGQDRFAECVAICQDIIDGVYGVYALEDTWWEPHSFDNDRSAEVIWTIPSRGGGNPETAWHWYWQYFYHYESGQAFGGVTGNGAPYNGFILSPSRNPQDQIYTEFRLGNPYEKFHDLDLRKQPFIYEGNKQYRGMFLVGPQTDPRTGAAIPERSGNNQLNFVDWVGQGSNSDMRYGAENTGIRLVKTPQPNLDDQQLQFEPDFPLIRLTEIYYMLAECKLRQGDTETAATLINTVRQRNFANQSDPDPVTAGNLDRYRMLDEWLIEFLGEGRRRTDLIRWDAFTQESWWDHEPTDRTKHVFPIPYTAMSANALLEQNPGY